MKLTIQVTFGLASVLLGLLGLSGCASHQPVNFNVHTEPEGAHIIYRIDNQPWIYLGVTPLNAVEVMQEDEFEGNETFSIKAMRCGYLEQAKEWSVDELLKENESKGMIFWTPRLIKNTE